MFDQTDCETSIKNRHLKGKSFTECNKGKEAVESDAYPSLKPAYRRKRR